MTKNSISRVRRSLLGLSAAILAAGFAVPAAAEDTVRFASVGGLTDAGLYIADELGFFKEQGISLKMMRMRNGPALLTAIATDQIDVAGIAITPGLFTAESQGIHLRIVGDKQSHLRGFDATRLVARKDLIKATPEETIKGLVGKTIAVSHKASSNFYGVSEMLEHYGVDINKVQVKELSFSAMATALASGAIDAANLIEPYMSRVRLEGIATDVANMGDIGGEQGYMAVPLVYSEAFAQKKDLGERFMVAYMKGVRDYNDAFRKNKDKEKVQEIIARRSGVDLKVVQNAYPAGLDPNQDMNLDSLKKLYEFFVERKVVKVPLNLEKLVDTSFAKTAVAKLGPYK